MSSFSDVFFAGAFSLYDHGRGIVDRESPLVKISRCDSVFSSDGAVSPSERVNNCDEHQILIVISVKVLYGGDEDFAATLTWRYFCAAVVFLNF